MKNKSARDMNSQRQQKPAMEKVLWTIICALPMVNFVESRKLWNFITFLDLEITSVRVSGLPKN